MNLTFNNNKISVGSDLFSDPDAMKYTLKATRNCCDNIYSTDITQSVYHSLQTTNCWRSTIVDTSSMTNPTITGMIINGNAVVSDTYDLSVLSEVGRFQNDVNNWLAICNHGSVFNVTQGNGLISGRLFTFTFEGISPTITTASVIFDDDSFDFESCNVMDEGLSVEANQFCIDPKFFNQTGTFEDGVYCITISAEYATGKTITDTGGEFVAKNLECDVVNAVSEGDFKCTILFDAIEKAIDCPSLDCKDDEDRCARACQLYKELLLKLGVDQKYNYDVTTGDCGCNK